MVLLHCYFNALWCKNLHRINHLALVADLIMQMRASGSSGISDFSNHLTALNALTGFNMHLTCVRVLGNKLIGMCNLNKVAIGTIVFSAQHKAITRRKNRGASRRRKIYPRVLGQ